MNKQQGFAGGVILILIAFGVIAGGGYYLISKGKINNRPEPVACTTEAKLCPDGSAVGRTGPKCEFAACPDIGINPNVQKGTLTGRVTIGPLCPIEPCNLTSEKLNQTYSSRKIFIYSPDTKVKIAETAIKVVGDHGEYVVTLDADSYLVKVSDGRTDDLNKPVSAFPGSTQPKAVVLQPKGTTTLDFDVDTGIR